MSLLEDPAPDYPEIRQTRDELAIPTPADTARLAKIGRQRSRNPRVF
jgi:hypothetical protein